MRILRLTIIPSIAIAVLAAPRGPTASAHGAAAVDCVSIAVPKPSIGYTYQLTQSNGT